MSNAITKSFLEARIKRIFGEDKYNDEQKIGNVYLRQRDIRVGGYALEEGYYGNCITGGKLSEINYFLDGVQFQQRKIQQN